MEYRREIDGLRAVAVLPVILFHAGFKPFSGGFVGVDIFFVISGYLITSILIAEQNAGTFTIAGFYERRARRILPALFCVMLVSLPFAWFWLLPSDMKRFSQSLVAVSGFVSNLLFWRTTEYFEPAAELKPLLHTWSLAVEEQYYVLFPLFLVFFWRRGRRWISMVLLFTLIASLMAAHWGATRQPAANFYLLPTRIWELLIGAIVAVAASRPGAWRPQAAVAETGAITGALLVLGAVFLFDGQTPFPSFYTLVPTLGTALIIVCAYPDTVTGRLLGSRILVGIGLISYSAYLWHQPLFAFARHRSFGEPAPWVFIALALTTVALAYVTWRYVEVPFRDRRIFSGRQIFGFAIAGTLLFTVVGLAGHSSRGFDARFDAGVVAALRSAEDKNPRQSECHSTRDRPIAPEKSCIFGNESRVVAALVGDSHADALAYAIGQEFQRKDLGLMQMTIDGCPPLFDVYRADDGTDCAAQNKGRLDYLVRANQIQYIVIAARWTLWLESRGFNNGEGGVEIARNWVDAVVDGKRQVNSESERRALIRQSYVQTVSAYLNAGKKVILVYPIPEVGWDVPVLAAKRRLFEQATPEAMAISTSYAVFQSRNRESTAVLDSLGNHANLFRVRPEQILCNSQLPQRCVAHFHGVALYTDDDHLSNAGATPVARDIIRYVRVSPGS